MGGAKRVRIRGAGCGADASNPRCLEALAMRQGLLPLVPDAVFPDGQLAIVLQARATLALHGAFPLRKQRGSVPVSLLLQNHAQYVEVMHLAQDVLQLLQIRAPRLVLLW